MCGKWLNEVATIGENTVAIKEVRLVCCYVLVGSRCPTDTQLNA